MSLKIEGKVTLDSNNIEGAIVRLLNVDTEEYLGFETTDTNGDYSFDLENYDLNTTDTFQLIVEYDDNGTLYNSISYTNIIIEE